ncbi:MAG: sensor histidine kinase [Verrucomicrobiota bacterium]
MPVFQYPELKFPFTKSNGGEQSPASLIAALVLVALVPAVGVLWFMSVAMRNERLAVQERLTAVYANHLGSLRSRVTAWATERQAVLAEKAQGAPPEIFAAVVRAGLADGVVVYDAAGKALYPASATSAERPAGEDADAARALQAQAAGLLQAGQKEPALAKLEELVGDAHLRQAVGAQGALIVPNAQLLMLKTMGWSRGATVAGAPRLQQVLDDLVARLNDYAEGVFHSSQRRFLMAEVAALAPGAAVFRTFAAEELSADYLDREPPPTDDAKVQRTPLPGVWRLPSVDGTVVALWREERLRTELEQLLGPLVLPGARVTVLAPGSALAASALARDAGEFFPGWRLALGFRDGDPLAEASARQARFYLGTGVGVVVVIAVVALLVARFVAAQVRLARLKNELVSTVSHELKTPLASMRALVDTLAARRYRDDAQLHDYLRLVAKENLRLSHLIENFLAFSRLERGQEQFRFAGVPPTTVVRAALEALGDKLAAPACAFTTRLAPALPAVRADADALTTVLVNLLDNAGKYTNHDKRIELRVFTAAGGSVVVFEVADNGIGLAREEQRRIFERFYQVDQSLTRQRGGCGLGLSIVDRIVRAHGGSVEVESEPGQGSVFRVRIPAVANQTTN